MVSLFNSLPAGLLWLLAICFILGSIVVIWKDRLSAFLRRRLKEGSPFECFLINVVVWPGKVAAILFYLFLFGFPVLFLFLSVLPTISITREHKLTAQDLLVYGQRRDAVKLLVPPIDSNLPLSSPEQVKADADKLRSIFNERDLVRVMTWAQLLAGEKYTTGNRRFTDDEAAHIAWRHLNRYPGTKESDLFNLEETIARAVPQASERRQLLEWGKSHNGYLDTSADILLFTRLPKLDWFAWWTVYTEYCPTEDGLAARKQFLIERLGDRRFNRDVWPSLVSWGKESYDNDASLSRQLPAGERAYVVAAIDRMVGLDEAGRKVYELDRDNKVPLGKDYTVLFLLMHVLYPNDDLAYMQFGTGWYGEHSLFATGTSGFSLALLVVSLFLVFWALLVQRCVRRLTIHYLGRRLGLGGNPLFENLSRVAFNPWLQLLALGIVIPITWLFARFFMEDFYVLYFRSEFGLLLAVVYGTLIGGALVEGIQNLLAVGCIRCGLNPERMIVDNLLAAGVSVGLLWFFQNSWFSIASGLALGLFTSIVLKVFLRSKGQAGAAFTGGRVEAPRAARRVEADAKGKRSPVRRDPESTPPPARPPKPIPRRPEQDNPPPVRRKRPPDDEKGKRL